MKRKKVSKSTPFTPTTPKFKNIFKKFKGFLR